jgi:hypothetical protein
MAIPKSVAALAVIVALFGSGCTQPDPNAAPTYTCTPSDGGTPAPCYKAEYDQQVKEDALYAEAEAVYRKYVAEDERIYRMGGIDKPTPVLLEVATGDFLQDLVIIYQASKDTRTKFVGGTLVTVWLRPAPSSATPDSLVTMQDCRDASTVKIVTPGEDTVLAGYTSTILHFVREGGSLKIGSAQGKVVDGCQAIERLL